MKQLFLTAIFALFIVTGFSQAYKLDELRTYYWNDATAQYNQQETQLYAYENGGIKETSVLGIHFATSENYYRMLKSYNDNNDISERINQEWNANTGDWSIFSKVIYDYGSPGRLIAETTQLYNDGSGIYENESRWVYGYTGSLNTNRVFQNFDVANDTWTKVSRDDMYYTNDLLSRQTSSTWNALNAEWVIQSGDTLIYDANDLLIERRYEEYSVIDDEWELDSRDTLTYSGTLLTEVLNQQWMNGGWRDEIKFRYEHDEHGNTTTFYYDSRNLTTGQLEPYYKEERDYSLADPVGIEAFAAEDNFKVYPNPVRDVLNLDFGSSLPADIEVQLFGIDGRLIKSTKLATGIHKSQLQLDDLQRGVYLLTFPGNKNRSYKIVKE